MVSRKATERISRMFRLQSGELFNCSEPIILPPPKPKSKIKFRAVRIKEVPYWSRVRLGKIWWRKINAGTLRKENGEMGTFSENTLVAMAENDLIRANFTLEKMLLTTELN